MAITSASVAPNSVRVRRRRQRAELLTDASLVIGSILAIAVLVKLAWPGFTYWGDNANSFMPLWHLFGQSLRAGSPLLFDHTAWQAANLVGEAAYGIFNPVTMLNAIAISFTDNLALASFIVMAEFLALLGLGVYMLARVYGASRVASMIVGIMVPFGGFTLFYEAGNWASGLMSITWVVHFWWAARAYTSGRMGPIAAVAFGGLAATVGNPYAVLGMLVVMLGLGVELILAKRYRRFLGLVLAGACIGAIIVFVYLPLLHVLQQIDRPYAETFNNTNYLTPSLGDLFGLSSPSYLPRMRAWTGTGDLVPSTYLGWLIVPLLPWLKWRSIGHWKHRASLITSSSVFLLFTLGPDTVWLFRWPIRLIEYSYVGLIILFALYLSSGLARDHVRRRLTLSGLAITSGAFSAWASVPPIWGYHLLVAVIVAGFVCAGLCAYRRFALRGLLVVVLIGTAVIAPLQASRFGWSYQAVGPDVDLSVPADLRLVRENNDALTGTVLQIADISDLSGTSAVYEGLINFGNTLAAAGVESVNRYTGLSFIPFKDALQMDFRGSVDKRFPLSTLFAPVSHDVDVPLVDAMGVDTLVISTARHDIATLPEIAVGWHSIERSVSRVVLIRNIPRPGPAVTGSDGVLISAVSAEPSNGVSFQFHSERGGYVLLDRLQWAGYSAAEGARELPLTTGAFGLVKVDVPSGTGEVEVRYGIPGFASAIFALLAGLLVAFTHEAFWRLRWLRSKRSWRPEFSDESAPTPAASASARSISDPAQL